MMGTEYSSLYIPCILLMVICVIFCAVPQIIHLARRGRVTENIIIGRVIIAVTAIIFTVNLCGYDLHPKIKQVVYTVLFFISLLLLLSAIGSKGVAFLLGSIICILFVLGAFLFDNAVVNREADGKEYVAVYSKWTGIGPTHVYYYERHFSAFSETKAEFVEDYGIVGVSWEDIFETDPNTVYRFEGE